MSSPRRSALERTLDLVSSVILGMAGVGLVVLIVIFGWLVFGRYVLNATPTWVEQVSLLLVAFIAFFGAAVGVRDDTHLSVEFFRDALPRRARRMVLIVNDLIMLVFGAVMAWFTGKLAIFKWDAEIPLLGLPEGLRSVPLSICGGLIVLFCAARIWRRLTVVDPE